MHFYATLLLAAVAQFANANAVPNPPVRRALEQSWGYATFYDDNACGKNPGHAVSMGNDGCLANEYGRNSIYIQSGTKMLGGHVSLVWSPNNECDCQDDCVGIKYSNDDYCWNLNGHAGANSFRFIRQRCGANNC